MGSVLGPLILGNSPYGSNLRLGGFTALVFLLVVLASIIISTVVPHIPNMATVSYTVNTRSVIVLAAT